MSPVALPWTGGVLGNFSKMAAAENRVFWGSDRFYFILINKMPNMLHFVICCVVGKICEKCEYIDQSAIIYGGHVEF